MTAALSVEGLSKSFGALKVTDDVTFAVAPGEALGIVGPNGAGKSTLFNLICGTHPADAGRIHLGGADVTALPALARCHRGVGRSFQIPRPFGGLTVWENLLVAAANGRDATEATVEADCAAILKDTGLEPFADAPSGSLSLLARKRLELARAMATSPEIVLLDEIAGGLTEAECGALIETIRDIRARGTAIVWIEHVLHALRAVVDRIVVLDFGRIIADGPAAEVMEHPEVRRIYLGIEA